MSGKHKDIYEEITHKVQSLVEKGTAPWQKAWKGSASFAMPMNATTGNSYHGINIPLLWIAADEMVYDCQEWGSYQQWQQQKKQVKRGEKGHQLIFYKTLEVEKESKVEEIPLIRYSHVFNACQLEGYKPQPKEERPLIERLDKVDEYIVNTGARIYHDGGNRAFYNRTSDDIHLPERDAFVDKESLYSVTFHELTHWTGAPHRLNREKGKRFGDKAYAYEEVKAQLGAIFECSKHEISYTRENDVAYLQNWLDVLQDKRGIFTAASEASKAVEYMDTMQHKVIPMYHQMGA